MNFKEKTKSQDSKKKQKKHDILKNLYTIFEGRERVLHAFESKLLPIKTKCTGYIDFNRSSLKILTPKKMLQRLPIALAQIKVVNNSESLIVYTLYQSKEIAKKVYKNVIKSIKV